MALMFFNSDYLANKKIGSNFAIENNIIDKQGEHQFQLRLVPWYSINLPPVYRASLEMPFFIVSLIIIVLQFLEKTLDLR